VEVALDQVSAKMSALRQAQDFQQTAVKEWVPVVKDLARLLWWNPVKLMQIKGLEVQIQEVIMQVQVTRFPVV
jgi:hypothetical protein